jgi:hypothetical protein
MQGKELTVETLVDAFGRTGGWWQKWRPHMAEIGVIHKIGGRYFGDLDRVDHWLATGEVRPASV